MMSSPTSAPESMTFLASTPSGVPALTAARNMSPVEICGMPYFWQMKVACVPLPAPGAPNKISLMDGSPPDGLDLAAFSHVQTRTTAALFDRKG